MTATLSSNIYLLSFANNGGVTKIFSDSKSLLEQLRPLPKYARTRREITSVTAIGNLNVGRGPYVVITLQYQVKYPYLFNSRRSLKEWLTTHHPKERLGKTCFLERVRSFNEYEKWYTKAKNFAW